MPLHGHNFIAGQAQRGSGRAFTATNPAGATALEPEFNEALGPDVDAALTAGAAAFEAFRALPGDRRAALLEAIGEGIVALGDELIRRAGEETGLGHDRLVGERARTVNQLKLFARVARDGSWVDARIDRPDPNRTPLPKPDLRRMLIPLGPVAVFGSSNFPLAFSVAGGDTASALATGNPVVFKAHRGHPGTSELVAGAINQAVASNGLPGGVFSMLHGGGRTIGVALVKHPLTRAVGFTGSRVAGRALFDVASARPEPIPVFAEMSSLNPLFILPGALKERATQLAEGVKNSVTLGTGQFCTKPGLVLVQDGPGLEAFRAELARQFSAAAPGTMLHQEICNAYQKGLRTAVAIPGVSLVGRSGSPVTAAQTHGEPTLLATTAHNFLSQPALANEVFGPFTLLIVAKSLDEMVAVTKSLEGQLTAGIHATDADLAQAGALLPLLEQKAGRLLFNGFPTGVEVCHAMQHGGPYPATTDVRFTSVGAAALQRFVRPACYQNVPETLLPDALKSVNPLKLWRLVDGRLTQDPL